MTILNIQVKVLSTSTDKTSWWALLYLTKDNGNLRNVTCISIPCSVCLDNRFVYDYLVTWLQIHHFFINNVMVNLHI